MGHVGWEEERGGEDVALPGRAGPGCSRAGRVRTGVSRQRGPEMGCSRGNAMGQQSWGAAAPGCSGSPGAQAQAPVPAPGKQPSQGKGICNVPLGKGQLAQPGSRSTLPTRHHTSVIPPRQWPVRASWPPTWLGQGTVGRDMAAGGEQEVAWGEGRCRLCLQAGRAAWTRPSHPGRCHPSSSARPGRPSPAGMFLPRRSQATKQDKDTQFPGLV